MTKLPVPSVGRVVHFVDIYEDGETTEADHYPAMVTWVETEHGGDDPWVVGLSVFYPDTSVPVRYFDSVSHDDQCSNQTWHWPERTRETG